MLQGHASLYAFVVACDGAPDTVFKVAQGNLVGKRGWIDSAHGNGAVAPNRGWAAGRAITSTAPATDGNTGSRLRFSRSCRRPTKTAASASIAKSPATSCQQPGAVRSGKRPNPPARDPTMAPTVLAAYTRPVW